MNRRLKPIALAAAVLAFASFSNSAGVGYQYGERRYVGIVFRGKI